MPVGRQNEHLAVGAAASVILRLKAGPNPRKTYLWIDPAQFAPGRNVLWDRCCARDKVTLR